MTENGGEEGKRRMKKIIIDRPVQHTTASESKESNAATDLYSFYVTRNYRQWPRRTFILYFITLLPHLE